MPGLRTLEIYLQVGKEYENVILETCYSASPRGLIEYFVDGGMEDKLIWGTDVAFMSAAPQLGLCAFCPDHAAAKDENSGAECPPHLSTARAIRIRRIKMEQQGAIVSDAQRQHFRTYGFVVFRQLFSADEIEYYGQALERALRRVRGGADFDGQARQEVMPIIEEDPDSFYPLLDDARQLDIVDGLLGEGSLYTGGNDGNLYVGGHPAGTLTGAVCTPMRR